MFLTFLTLSTLIQLYRQTVYQNEEKLLKRPQSLSPCYFEFLLSLFSILNEKLEMFLYELGHYIDVFYTRDVTFSQKCLLKMTKNVRLGWPVLASLTLYQRKKNPFFLFYLKKFSFWEEKKKFSAFIYTCPTSLEIKKMKNSIKTTEGRKEGTLLKRVSPIKMSTQITFQC